MGQAAEWGVRARRSIAAIAVGLLVLQSPVQAQAPNPAADLDRNGIVDMDDFIAVGDCVSATIMGLPVPPECGQMQDPHPAGGGDGDWDFDDYLEVQSNFGEVFDVGDDTPPTIVISEPADGALLDVPSVHVRGTVDDLNLEIELEVSNAAGIKRVRGSPGGSSMDFNVRQVPLQPGGNLLTVRATDLAGNVGSHSIEVTYQPPDRVPPEIGITRPAAGAVLTESPIAVSGTVNEPAATVRVNGVIATVADGMFTAQEIVLAPGPNTIEVTATDPSGNSSAQSVLVTYAPDLTAPVVSITSPLTGTILNESPIDVSGTVDDAAATVVVNSVHAPVNAGAFTAVGVTLKDGLNTIRVTATDPAGNQGSDEIQVTYQSDATAPVVQILSPADGAVLAQGSIGISGTVDDPTATLTFNGAEVSIIDGTFTISDVALILGSNTFEVIATDPAGNRASDQIRVSYEPDITAPSVVIVSPHDGAAVHQPSIQVSGSVDDNAAKVLVNGTAVAVEQGAFTAAVGGLSEGTNRILVRATDPAGNTSEVSIAVTFLPPDTVAPSLSVDGGTGDRLTEQSEILLEGTVADETDPVTITVYSQAFGGAEFAAAVESGRWRASLPLSAGANPIEVRARDSAGNSTVLSLQIQRQVDEQSVRIEVIYPARGAVLDDPNIVVRGRLVTEHRAEDLGVSINGVAATLAASDEATIWRFTSDPLSLHEGGNSLLVSGWADGRSAQELVQVVHRGTERTLGPPEIRVFSPGTDSLLPSRAFVLAGEVMSEAGLAELRIDGQLVPLLAALPGPYDFNEPFFIAQGAQRRTLLLEAKDTLGQIASRSIVVRLDDQAPMIELDRDLSPAPSVNDVDQLPYPLSGSVTDASLAGFTISGQEVQLRPGASVGRYEFSANLALAAGVEQEVLLVATDHAGNTTRSSFILRADADLTMTLLDPALDLTLNMAPDQADMRVSVRLNGEVPAALESVLLNAASTVITTASLTGEGVIRTGQILLPHVAGSYRLEVRALDEQGAIQARTARSIELVDVSDAPPTLANSEPAPGANDVEPNAPVTLYFSRPIDPTLIQLSVHETAHGHTYVDRDAPGTDPIFAKGHQLESVTRSHEPVNGSLSLLPGARTLAFYPDRELAYDAEVFVNISYDGAALGHFNYRTRPLPTMLSGSVHDVFGQAVPGVEVSLPEQSRRATTDRNGGFSMGYGDSAAQALEGGRWLLEVNQGMSLAGFGSRRQWITIQDGRSNEIGILRLAQLNPDVPPVPLASGDNVMLLDGTLNLDFTLAQLEFPDAREEGDLYAQFLSFSQLPYPATELAIPHFVFGIHPAGVEVEGEIRIDLEVPKFRHGYDHLPPEDSFVILVGLDPRAGRIVPVGVGQVQGHRIISRGAVAMQVLDVIGYALAAPEQQDALKAYASGQLNLPRLLAALRSQQ